MLLEGVFKPRGTEKKIQVTFVSNENEKSKFEPFDDKLHSHVGPGFVVVVAVFK